MRSLLYSLPFFLFHWAYPLTDLFWYQDRPLVGMPPMPSQYYRPPDNDIRRCAGTCPQKRGDCKKPTIMDWNYCGNDYSKYPDHHKPNDRLTRRSIFQRWKACCNK